MDIDHVAIPDFKYGGMENWGLAMYTERYFLYDTNKTSMASEQLILRVIVHETSHQWFGNLVTPRW